MVGVPGRSKGCLACRKRKIACSQERPECTICVRAGRECPGYQRERIFVHVDPSAKGGSGITSTVLVQRPAKRDTPLANETLRTASLKSKPSPEEKRIERVADAVSSTSRAFSDNSSSTAIISRPSLAAKSYHLQLLGAFLARYGLQMHRGTKGIIGQHWLSQVPERPHLSRALDAAATAFCTAKLGRACSDKRLSVESLKLYGNGLRELQLALWDPRQMYSDDTLGACVLLLLYEVFECPSQSQDGYLSHLNGCARLIQMRGPQAHVSGMGHSIFTSFRFIGGLEALRTKRSFLETPAWRTIPFNKAPQPPFSAFIDLLLEAPALMRRGDIIAQLPTPAQQLAHSLALLQGLWDLEARMRTFYADFEISMSGELYWTRLSGVESTHVPPEEDSDDLFPVHFAFPNTHIAGLLMLYWACLTMLYVGIVRVHGLIQYLHHLVPAADLAAAQSLLITTQPAPHQQSPSITQHANTRPQEEQEEEHGLNASNATSKPEPLDPSNLPPLTRALSFSVTGRNVCQSVAYCLEDTSDELSVTAVTAPLHIVRDTFAGWPGACFAREIRWIDGTLAKVVGRGVGIVRYLRENTEKDTGGSQVSRG